MKAFPFLPVLVIAVAQAVCQPATAQSYRPGGSEIDLTPAGWADLVGPMEPPGRSNASFRNWRYRTSPAPELGEMAWLLADYHAADDLAIAGAQAAYQPATAQSFRPGRGEIDLTPAGWADLFGPMEPPRRWDSFGGWRYRTSPESAQLARLLADYPVAMELELAGETLSFESAPGGISSTANIPEPATYGLLAGVVALAGVLLRRLVRRR